MANQGRHASHFSSQDFYDDEPATIRRTPTHARAGQEAFDVIDEDYVEQTSGNGGRKKGRTGCLVALFVLLILIAVGTVGGYYGYHLYQSAMGVQAEAKSVMGNVKGLKDAISSGNSEELQRVAQEVNVAAYNIHDEVNTNLWDMGTMIPFVGSDIKSVRVLADVMVDLSDNALTPIASNAGIMDLKNVFHDGAIDINALQNLTNAMEQAAPALSRSADAVSVLPEARIGKINEVLGKVKDTIVEADDMLGKAQEILPYLPQMLGANGQTRRYLIIAQNNAEARSTGGLPGSTGVLSMTDGRFELGDFDSILHPSGIHLEIDQPESSFWQTNYNTDPAQVSMIADFARQGTYWKQFWSVLKYEDIDGAFAIDPVFLQEMLGLTGSVMTEDGTELNGDNTAAELLNNVYWRYGNNGDAQDWYFSTTASLVASSFFEHIGDADMMKLMSTFFDLAEKHRFLAWMVNEEEEEVMVKLGVSGKLGVDPAAPELGIYVNDVTYSKMSWYLRINVEVGNGKKNLDGTTTYPITLRLSNAMTQDEVWYAPRSITGTAQQRYSVGDMMTRLYVLGPAGGTLSDAWSEDGESLYVGSVYGLDGFLFKNHTAPENSDLFTFNVTVSSEAKEPLTVRTTPLGSDDFVTITYAWEN